MKKITILTISILFMLSSCEDFIEKNLAKEKVVLLSPLHMDTLQNTVSFWWEKVEGVSRYQLELVKNTFDAPILFILDTTIAENSFKTNLSKGKYEWRVKAVNNSSESKATYRQFFIDESTDLSNGVVTLVRPSNNANNNTLVQSFKWNTLLGAKQYEIEVKDNAGDIFAYESTYYDSIRITLNEGKYTWRVKAKNETTISNFSTKRNLLVDITPPEKPILISPTNNKTDTNRTQSFSWNSGNSLATITDTLYIYSDSLVTLLQKVYTETENINYNFTQQGIYFWRMRAGDAAGNKSQFTDTRKLSIY